MYINKTTRGKYYLEDKEEKSSGNGGCAPDLIESLPN